MPRTLARLLAFLAVPLIVVLAIAAILLLVVRPDAFRGDIEAAVDRATGRVLALGPLHLHLGLSPSLEAEGATLSNIAGGSQPQMLTAKSLRANIALLPLITGEIEIDSLTLVDPVVLLETTPDGTPNWVFSPGRPIPAATPQAASAAPSSGRALAIRSIHVENGQAIWAGEAGLRVDQLTLDASASSQVAPVAATGGARLDTVPVHLVFSGGSLDRLTGPVTLMAGPWPFSLQLQAGGGTAKIEGGIRHPGALRGYDVSVTANAPDLAPFAPILPPAWRVPMKDVNIRFHVTDGSTGDIQFSRVSLHAGATDLGALVPGLSIVSGSFSALGPGQDAQLNVDGTYNSAPLRLAGNGTQPDVPPTAPAPVTLAVQAAGASLSLRGILPGSWDGTGLDLNVSARIPDLAALQPFVVATLPPLRDVAADFHLGDGPGRSALAIRQASVTSSAGDIGGDVVVDWSRGLSVKGTLTSRTLSLDALTPPARAQSPPPAAASPGTQPPLAPSDPGFLADDEADLGLTVKSLVAAGSLYRDVMTHLVLHEGKLRLDPMRFSEGSGVVTGNFAMDATQDPPPITVVLRAPSLPASALAALAGHPGAASGTLQMAGHLSAVGLTEHKIGASLTGHLGVTMVDGEVSDDWLRSLLGQVLNTANIPAGPPGGQDHVRCFAALADFDHGQASLRSGALDTAKFALTGTGTFGLADGTLDLALHPTLRLGGTDAAMAMRVTGTFSAPRTALDPNARGRVGIEIGGDGSDPCPQALADAREGQPGPLPGSLGMASDTKGRKPLDLLKGLFH